MIDVDDPMAKSKRPAAAVPSAALFAIALLVAAVPGDARGGVASLRGEDPAEWSEYKISVLVATVKQVAPDEAKPRQFHATLVPLGTLSGGFDCGLHPTLDVTFSAGALGTTSIRQAPEARATVIAVVREVTEGQWVIVSHGCRFMPGGSSLVIVDNPADPTVMETLTRIQRARAKGLAAHSKPASDRSEGKG